MYYMSGDEVGRGGGFRRRGGRGGYGGGGGGGGYGGGGGGGGYGGGSQEIEAETVLGEYETGESFVDGDGEEYDVIEQDVAIEGVEIDVSGAPTGRRRRIGNRVKRIMRKRQNLHDRYARQDARLASRQSALERKGHLQHQQMPWEHSSAPGCGAHGNKVVAAPLAALASVAAAATGTLTMTPQFPCTVDKVVMSASLGQLQAVTVNSILFGVTPLYSNPEATSGWLADAFAQNGTLGDFLKGRQLVPQTPVKFSVTNGHTATQSISVFIKTETTAGAYATAAA